MRLIIDLNKECKLERTIILYLELLGTWQAVSFILGRDRLFSEIRDVKEALQSPAC